VVPTGGLEAWSFDPFAAAIRDGALCGRGAADMKGAIGAFIAAADGFIAARGGSLPGSISLLLTGDEEGDAVNGTVKVLDWLKRRGEVLDACVVGEPTSAAALGDMIKIGRRGSMTGRLAVEGVQGHVAYPHLVDNAAHRLVAMLHALTQSELDPGTEHFQASSLQVTTIDIGNPATNVAPGLRARSSTSASTTSGPAPVSRSGCATSSRRSAAATRSNSRSAAESFLVPPGALSQRLAQAIRSVTGREPELSTTGGTSDARFIHVHCPVAEFGLVGATMHKVDERVELSDIAGLTRIYREFLDLFFSGS